MLFQRGAPIAVPHVVDAVDSVAPYLGHNKLYRGPKPLDGRRLRDNMSSRYGGLLLAITLLVAATPVVSADEPTAGTCVGYEVSRAGEGVGAYLDTLGSVYAIQVAFGAPENGLTMTVLIGPTLCLGPSAPIGGLPPPPELGQSAPRVPILP